MPSARATVLYDLTPLDTQSRVRGIGRYVRDLALGLSRLPESEREGLRFVGLTRLGWLGDAELTDDLGSFEGTKSLRPGPNDDIRFAYKRRVALARAVRRLRPDIVHLGDPNATPLFFGATGCKLIVTCHDLIPIRFADRYLDLKHGGKTVGSWIQRRRYVSADMVVAISDATREDCARFLGIPSERLVRVYNGIDLSRWTTPATASDAEVPGRYGLGGRSFVLYVGDGDWRKNVEGMVGGLARARAAGVDVKLAWAGKLSARRIEALDAQARTAGVQDHVVRLGFVPDDDLRALYRASVAHLFVSRSEGFGLTVVEAMAAGCPVITTQAGSLAEIAEGAALTVDPEEHGAIGDAIARLCRSPELRDELVRFGRERAPTFSIEAQARGMVEVYRRVASSARRQTSA